VEISRLSTCLLTAILIVGAILRFNHITQPLIDAFSWRETDTAMMAENYHSTNWNILCTKLNWDGPGPGYQGREFQTLSYLTALLYLLVGQHDWVGRAVAVMFGLWGIFALYQLVRRVWDEQRAVASAAVMALLPGSIFIERSFLPDPAMVALVTTATWLLVAYLQTDRWPYLILASVIGTWGFLTKITGLIVAIPMLYSMLAILSRRRMLHPSRLATLGTAAVFGLVPLVGYYLWARHLALSYPPYHFAGSGNWLWDNGLREWWNHSYFLPRLYQRFSGWIWTGPVILLVLLGLLCPFLKQGRASWAGEQEPSRNEASVDGLYKAPWLFHWWLLAGIVYYFIGAQELVENPWNFHIIDPAAAALTGHGIVVLTSFTARLARPFISAGLLLVIAVSGQRGLTAMYKPYAEQSYRLGLALRQLTRRSDLVVTVANAIGDPTAIYYSGRRGWVFPPASVSGNWVELPENDEESIRFFEALRVQGADWLGIVAEQKKELWQDHAQLMSYIQRTCEFTVETRDYVIYRIRGPEKAVMRSLVNRVTELNLVGLRQGD